MVKRLDAIVPSALRQTQGIVHKLANQPLYLRLSGAAALLLIIAALGLQLYHTQLYTVSTASRQLITKSSVDVSKIKATATTVSFNVTDQQSTKSKNVTIAGPTDATGKTGYQATINTDFKQGLSFGDSGSELSFQLTPLFSASAGEYKDGQVLFPVSTSTRIIQTFKKNGLKEDIVLTKAPARTASWQWRLGLGDKLSAKLLPDGSVGIFAANPNLYGNIQINDAKSQALIDKARTTDKTYLLFAIPAPYIKNAQGQTLKEDVSFKLAGDTLTLEARNLTNQKYPISIDPSAVVTTTADFATNYYDDGMIDYSTANQIGRSAVSLGSVGTTTQQTNAFTTARNGHTSVAYNGYLYVIGGYGSSYLNDIQHCPINSDGSIGTCVQQTNAFTTARYRHTSVAYNGYLYVIGGLSNGGVYQDDIQHCPINSDGSIGTCVQQTAAFTARYGHASVAYNGYLYVIGGNTGTAQSDIQHCPINSDGSVGACTQQTAAFTTARFGHTSVAYNGYLYVIGGYTGSVYKNDIQHCPINADGSVGTCVQQATAFTTARYYHTSLAYNGYLYVIGGFDGSATQYDIQHCPINSDGSVGACVQQAAAFTTARYYHASVAYNGYLYVIGGTTGTSQNDIQHLLIDTGTPTGLGAVGATTQQTNAFTTARYHHTSVAYNGYLYVIGGTTGVTPQNDIQYCPINADGSVGTCVQQTSAFTTARHSHTSVAYNGYLYIIGGNTGSLQNDIQHCPINSDGSVGTCVQQTNAFTTARRNHASVVYNGYLYILGGNTGTAQNDIQHCPINADGSVGTCVQQTAAFTGARDGLTTAAYNGYLYVVGGNAGTWQNDIQHCPINSDGSVGTCVQQTAAFTPARDSHTSVAYNGYLYILGGYSGTADQDDIQHCPINSDGSVGTCVQQTAAFTTARDSHASAVYNGYLYVVGGYNGAMQNDIQHLSMQSPAQVAHYERTVDIGSVAGSVDSIQYNGTAKCGEEIQYATAGSDGIFGSLNTLLPDAVAGTTYTLTGQTAKRYVRVVITLNDQSCGGTSTVTDITVNYTAVSPYAPTLSVPTSGAVSVSLTPLFQLKTTDTADIYARYKIEVYQSNCSTLVRTIDQTSSQTGWSGQDAQTSTAYVMGTTLGASTLASHTYQTTALTAGTTYCWKAAAIDPGGSNAFGSYSATQLFTTNQIPPAPTLTQPSAGQTGVSTTPELRLNSVDPDGDYLRYKIDICSTSDCSSIVRTIDQTSSQTGWASQSQQSATAYSSGQMAIHTYQATALSANTQYWWRAYAIDPGGTNTFSPVSSISIFTTASNTQNGIIINGNSTINGNTKIGQ